MKHKNELDRLIRNLYLIKNTNLNNILETDKLAITRTTNFIEALINKIDLGRRDRMFLSNKLTSK